MTQTLPENKPGVWRRFGMILGIATAALVATMAVGWVPTTRVAGSQGAQAMLIAGAITWVVFLISMIPVLLWGRDDSDPQQTGLAILAATAIRFLLILLVILPIVLLKVVPIRPFLIWIVISYLAVLAADTAALLCFLSRPKD